MFPLPLAAGRAVAGCKKLYTDTIPIHHDNRHITAAVVVEKYFMKSVYACQQWEVVKRELLIAETRLLQASFMLKLLQARTLCNNMMLLLMRDRLLRRRDTMTPDTPNTCPI